MLHQARLRDLSTLALAPRAQNLPSPHSFPIGFPDVPNPSTSPRATEEEETRFSQLSLCCFAVLSLLLAPLHLPISSSLLSPLFQNTHSHLNNIHRELPSSYLLRSRYSGVRFCALCAAVTLLGRFFRGLKGRDPWRLILFFCFPCASFSWSFCFFFVSFKSCR